MAPSCPDSTPGLSNSRGHATPGVDTLPSLTLPARALPPSSKKRSGPSSPGPARNPSPMGFDRAFVGLEGQAGGRRLFRRGLPFRAWAKLRCQLVGHRMRPQEAAPRAQTKKAELPVAARHKVDRIKPLWFLSSLIRLPPGSSGDSSSRVTGSCQAAVNFVSPGQDICTRPTRSLIARRAPVDQGVTRETHNSRKTREIPCHLSERTRPLEREARNRELPGKRNGRSSFLCRASAPFFTDC